MKKQPPPSPDGFIAERAASAIPGVYSFADLQNETFAPLKRIAGDIIVEGLTLLAARPKIGKTWLMLDIAIAVAQGTYCLGDIKCEPGDVLFLALEDNRRRMMRRGDRLLGARKAAWPRRLQCTHTWPRADQGGLERLREWIESANNPRLVVIDVLQRFRKRVPPGKQSYEGDYDAIADLQKIASETDVAIVVIHHTRKGEADDPLDAVSGTLGLGGAADAILILARTSQGVQLYGRSRDVDEIDKAIEFNKATCHWTILGDAADIRRSEERRRIIAALQEEGGPMTPKDIAAVTGQRISSVHGLIRKMAKQGEVVKAKYGVYSLPDTPSTPGTSGPSEQVPWGQDV